MIPRLDLDPTETFLNGLIRNFFINLIKDGFEIHWPRACPAFFAGFVALTRPTQTYTDRTSPTAVA
jgi:hypothetical protein